jgi:hypothetical protein
VCPEKRLDNGMTDVPLSSRGGDIEALASTPSSGAEGGPGEVRGISDLAQRIVTATYLGHPRLHRGLVITVGVLVATCVIAVATRWSFLPLVPVPLFAVAAFALRRIRLTKHNYRYLLAWSGLFVIATLVGFWLMSVVARRFG